uniref:EXPERA domain-containing protein n=1 Tax=Lotharella oceanica TaxID=641309 RepID=A0A7S2U1Z8_9EUKA|mmetsp:Transcript_6719/g.13331  ORF Transcript_6719/g.13331 Transcript_6719/m.13331 type:complete len:238 (+) Transcript_6719:37-750(+)
MDPSFAFVAFVWLTPFLLEVAMPLPDPALSTPQQILQYVFAWPPVVFGLVGVALVWLTHRGKCLELTPSQRMLANWYLVNGCFFMSAMDFSAGTLQAWPGMWQRYIQLDRRYGKPWDGDGITVTITGLQEILIQAPSAMFVYYAMHRGHSWRLGVEMLFNLASTLGTWYFYLTEAFRGFPNTEGDNAFHPSFQSIYRFWIGTNFFCLLWFTIGVCNTARTMVDIARLASAASSAKDV